MKTYYIGADLHCNNVSLAIEYRKDIIRRFELPTSIPAVKEALAEVGGKQHLAVEEGPMAGWFYRNLKDSVASLTVCDPKRNKHIACDGDKDDRIDSGKLAALLRGKFVRPVHHSDDEDRVELKRWVGLYHDRVKHTTGTINKLRAQARMYGMQIPSAAMKSPEIRMEWLNSLENKKLAKRLELLWIGLDASREQVKIAKGQMEQLAKSYPIIGYWKDLSGIGPIRAITLFAYLDTPWRFQTKSKLWKYCGIGLVRATSGTDRHGRPKPTSLRPPKDCNRRLKGIVMSATLNAIRADNVFKRDYERMISQGMIPGNARRTIARKILAILWGMWKSNSRFNEELC